MVCRYLFFVSDVVLEDPPVERGTCQQKCDPKPLGGFPVTVH